MAEEHRAEELEEALGEEAVAEGVEEEEVGTENQNRLI